MLLEVEDVNKSFGGLQALSDVTLTIEAGTITGLIGPNGSGKSTLFNVITGTMPASSGAIRLQGEDITHLPAHAVAQRGIGRTFQTGRPFMSLTVQQNVMAGCLYGAAPLKKFSDASQRAHEVLELVGLADKTDAPASQLNAMSRKWLEVARALATSPKLLLLDEFMAGLNPTEVQQAIEFIRRLKDLGITVIVVEHIIKAIMTCSDRVVVLNAGMMIADGPPAEIVQDPHVINVYLGTDYAQG